MVKTIYINLEDDISKIVARLKREKVSEVVLVFPRRSFMFSDSINMRLLKKQVDMLGKTVWVLTMDERGQIYSKEAGFGLKFLARTSNSGRLSDVKPARPVFSAAETHGDKAPIRRIKKVVKRAQGIATVPQVYVSDTFFSDLLGPEVPKTGTPEKPSPKGLRSRMYNRAIVGFVALSLIIILLLVFLVLPRADIVVYARTEPVARDIEVSMAARVTSPDPERLVMPASYIERTLELRNKFTATGKKEVGNKAGGKVVVYNLTGKPLNLKASTTTLTAGNKNYSFTLDQNQLKVSREGASDAELNIAEIVATAGGEEYNLPAGTRLEISNQVFGSRPQLLYAKTQSSIIGGTSRFLSIITEADIANAREALASSMVDQINKELAGKGQVIPDKAFTVEPLQFSTDKPAGTESPAFEGYLSMKLQALAFDRAVLSNLIRQRIISTVAVDRVLQNSASDTLTYKLKSADLSNQVIMLSIHFESQLISQVDISDVTSQVLGKSKQQVSELLLSKPQVGRVDITLSPSWQRTVPRFSRNVKLEVKK